MPFLKLGYSLLVYEDANNSKNPDIRNPDISREVQQIPVDDEKSERITLGTGEIRDILTTQRAVSWDATTELSFLFPIDGQDFVRIQHTGTGTAPVFRTNRSIGGDATTEVTITRVTNYVARIQNTAGTAWTLGSVQVNDIIKFDKDTDAVTTPFGTANKGKEFTVQGVGPDYIDFIDNGVIGEEADIVLGADFDKILKVLSQSPTKKGDTVEVSGAGINPSNHGKFEIIDISDDWVEIVNPLAREETALYGSNSLVVYEYLIGFVHLRASAPIKIRFNSQTEWMQVTRLGPEAILISSTCAHKIQAYNDNPEAVVMSIQHARVLG